MTLRLVAQEHYTGCFIACVAMLLGKSYAEAFRLLHPGQEPETTLEHGWREMSMEHTAHRLLQVLGFQSRTSKYRRFRTFQSRVNSHAIMIIRWTFSPDLCHCILYDAGERKFIDPSYAGYASDRNARWLQNQLDTAIIIDKIPMELTNDLPRSHAPHRTEG